LQVEVKKLHCQLLFSTRMCGETFSHPLTSSGLIVGRNPVEVQSASLALKIFVFNNPETFLLCLEILYLILIACEQRESRIIVETEAKGDTALNLKKNWTRKFATSGHLPLCL